MKSLIIISLVPLFVLAIDSINPQSACDRFINLNEQKNCQSKVQKIQPDSYLTSICQKQFDDDAFWDCMELSTQVNFDPKLIEKCSQPEISDQQRLSCIKETAEYSSKPKAQYQNNKTSIKKRKPATQTP